jgi:hypothetical protein
VPRPSRRRFRAGLATSAAALSVMALSMAVPAPPEASRSHPHGRRPAAPRAESLTRIDSARSAVGIRAQRRSVHIVIGRRAQATPRASFTPISADPRRSARWQSAEQVDAGSAPPCVRNAPLIFLTSDRNMPAKPIRESIRLTTYVSGRATRRHYPRTHGIGLPCYPVPDLRVCDRSRPKRGPLRPWLWQRERAASARRRRAEPCAGTCACSRRGIRLSNAGGGSPRWLTG